MNGLNNAVISSDETISCSFGTESADEKSYKVCGAVTNKRIYLRGHISRLNASGTVLSTPTDNKVIELSDIRSTGFQRIMPNTIWLVLAIVLTTVGALEVSDDVFVGSVILLTAFIIFILFYITQKKVYLIEYDGGNVAINLKRVNRTELEKFDRVLYMRKDDLDKPSD